MPAPDPLERFRALDISSADFTEEVTKLLLDKEYQKSVPSLRGENLIWLVEFLDNVVDKLDLAHPALSICFFELRSICGTRRIIPRSSTISSAPLSVGDQPFASGGLADVYEGSFNDSKVCVEKVRMYSNRGPQGVEKMFYLETVTWQHLKHPNIVPFLGATVDPPQLISVWMPGGFLTGYINEHPESCRLALLHDVAEGLNYLHFCSVIHGDIKGSNILVDRLGRARITDFAHATITMIQGSACDFTERRDRTTQWTAPEILEGQGRFTKESDVFSFAMVMVEIFTGAVPFGSCPLLTSVMHILQGKRPPRPTNLILTDDLWALMQRCWDQQPKSRPQMSGVLKVVLGFVLKQLLCIREFSESSPDFQLTLDRFYGSVEYKGCVTHLHGTAPEKFINFLDGVLRVQGLTQGLLEQTLQNLREACDRWATFPGSHIVSGELSKLTVSSHAVGGYREVRRGALYPKGDDPIRTDVCVKTVRIEKIRNGFHGDVALWVASNHPNILQCFGITLDPLQIVMQCAPNGNVMEYLWKHHDADRIRLLIEMAQGLVYLHSYGVVHGNLKPENVLVNVAGSACLSDVGLPAATLDGKLEFSWDNVGAPASRRVAPEIFKNGESSKQSDMFSYGFVAAELFLGESLWEGSGAKDVRSRIVDGKPPRVPEGKEELGLTAEFWWTLAKCWEMEPEDRIPALDMLDFLFYMPYPFSSGTSYGLNWATAAAQHRPDQGLIDELDQGRFRDLSDRERPEFLNMLCKMCDRQQVTPTSMDITNCHSEEPNPVKSGGNADVFRGVHHTRRVAIKVVRVYLSDLDRHRSRFCREAVAWKHLQHPNILPLLGVKVEQRFEMVSEWMDHGNINEFIQQHGDVNRAQLLVDVAHGLEYLHGLRIVHGDLKGANILIKKDHRACLADFGLSTIVYAVPRASANACLPFLASEISTDSGTSLVPYTSGGTFRWMSPEILVPDMFGLKECRPSKQSDCYSFAMTVYEVLCGNAPYSSLPENVAVNAILDGVRPRKPHLAITLGFTDGLWKIMERCWMVERDARPDVKAIISQLNHAAWTWDRNRFV